MLQAHPLTANTISALSGEMEKTIIIGMGEIGKSLFSVLSSAYYVRTFDKKDSTMPFPKKEEEETYKVMHVCFPYSENFVEEVKKYINIFKPELVIIHSTVKVGTTREIGEIAVHSPVNGKHPNLAESIRTFVKFIGGQNVFQNFKAVTHLQKAGINTHVFASPETTELAKILCTTQYGISIIVMKEIVKLCEEYKVPFHEVYTEWNINYNNSYSRMNENRFTRPVLFPQEGEIGGHCVVPNCDLLSCFLTKTVKEKNKEYKKKGKYEKRKK